MNGIGITEWRDVGQSSAYPLENGLDYINIFSDATFVQFDNFIPSLTAINVNSSAIIFSFLFDDGALDFTINGSDCIEDNVIKIYRGTRYHGQLVLGSNIITIFNKNGYTFSTAVSFLPITIRSIPSKAGVYTLQGLKGDVVLKTDDAQYFVNTSDSSTWNAVSKPSKVAVYTLDTNNFYTVNALRKFVEVDAGAGTNTILFDTTDTYTAIAPVQDMLLGCQGADFYNLSLQPPQKLFTVSKNVKAMGFEVGSGKIIALSDTTIFHIDPDDGTESNSIALGLTSGTGLVVLDTNSYLFTVTGPMDRNTSTKVSDLIYSCINGTVKVRTLINIGGNRHTGNVIGMALIDGTLTSVIVDSQYVKVVQLDPSLGTGTVLYSFPVNQFTGAPICACSGGGVLVRLNSVVPLKQINSVSPVNNAIHIVGNDVITISQTGAQELTISLAPDIDNTNITRSTTYE